MEVDYADCAARPRMSAGTAPRSVVANEEVKADAGVVRNASPTSSHKFGPKRKCCFGLHWKMSAPSTLSSI